jgi:hypothetical protein
MHATFMCGFAFTPLDCIPFGLWKLGIDFRKLLPND